MPEAQAVYKKNKNKKKSRPQDNREATRFAKQSALMFPPMNSKFLSAPLARIVECVNGLVRLFGGATGVCLCVSEP